MLEQGVWCAINSAQWVVHIDVGTTTHSFLMPIEIKQSQYHWHFSSLIHDSISIQSESEKGSSYH